jgi:DNA-binding XRE family transcriptional regulator
VLHLRKLTTAPRGSEIEAFRRRVGLGAEELAVVLGVNRATVYRWEVDDGRARTPSPDKKPNNTPATRVLGWLLEQDDAACEELRALFDERRSAGRLDILVFELVARAQHNAT